MSSYKTRSYCEKCGSSIHGEYIFKNGKTLFKKICDIHGETVTDICINEEDFKEWMNMKIINIPPKVALTKGSDKGNSECPIHCGTCDNHLQTACCVVIDITERCNQHCPYCFASADEKKEKDISIEEIEKKLDFLIDIGEKIPFNIQYSGGEPTVRDDLPEIVKMTKEKGFSYVQINSNGKRFSYDKEYAKALKEAGTSVIFMQFDGTNDKIYRKLRNENLLEIKKQAIKNLNEVGIAVTLVPTIVKGVNEKNIQDMVNFAIENIEVVKGIHFQPVSYFGRHPEEKNRSSMFEIISELENGNDFINKEDFMPITSGHPLCCFYSIYLKDGNKLVSQLGQKEKEEGISCCDTGSIGNYSCGCEENIQSCGCEENVQSCGCEESIQACDCSTNAEMSEAEKLKIIEKDRAFVMNKWEVSREIEDACYGIDKASDIKTMDQFIAFYKRNTFTISAMPFQDVETLDSERLKRCRVQVLSKDNKLIPFCAYNSIYRDNEK